MQKINSCLKVIVMALTVGASCQVTAAVRHYSASASDSQWLLSSDTRIECGITHVIPRYGSVVFTSMANKKPNLAFELDMLRLPDNYGLASVTSVAPEWLPGIPTKTISTMDLKKQFNPDMPEQAAWTMLTELEQGFIPTIYYADWHGSMDKVAVGLSAINFADTYDKFLQCMSQLLPYSFDDIAYTVLNYEKNSDQLSRDSKKRLSQIGEYLKHNPKIDAIEINAYADSHGGRETNRLLSIKRAKMIQTYLTELGVEKERVIINGYGEKRHVASNQTELGRHTNRRVVIQIVKP